MNEKLGGMTPITSLREEADRAAFELWYVGHTFDKKPPEIERDGQGYYILMQARQAWNAYHAAWMTGRNALVNELEDAEPELPVVHIEGCLPVVLLADAIAPSHPEYRSSGEKPCCGFPVGGPCPDCPAAAGVTVSDCTEPNRAACPRRCIDFCNKAEEAAAGVKGTPALPTTEELESLWETTHYGHPADFGADVLERWGGWMPGLLGHGGALQEAVKLQAQRNAGVLGNGHQSFDDQTPTKKETP